MPREKPNPEAAPAIGDNAALNAADRDKLKNLVDRISTLEEERAGLAEDVRSIYGEAKSAGFNAAALREIVRRRRLKPEQREAREARQAVIDAYVAALGGLADLPLGQAAIARASAELVPPV